MNANYFEIIINGLNKNNFSLLLSTIWIGIFISCSSVQEFIKTSVQKPEVKFVGARLNGLSFEAVDLLFDLNITNPNPV